MKICVRIKTGVKMPYVKAADETNYTVAVREPARDGRANAAVIRVLARHLGVAPSRIILVRGKTAKQKVFEIS